MDNYVNFSGNFAAGMGVEGCDSRTPRRARDGACWSHRDTPRADEATGSLANRFHTYTSAQLTLPKARDNLEIGTRNQTPRPVWAESLSQPHTPLNHILSGPAAHEAQLGPTMCDSFCTVHSDPQSPASWTSGAGLHSVRTT